MQTLQISKNGRYLEQSGKPFFWLADTCWSAFTNISNEEWIEYLDLRKEQGFNVLQINTLPQWDRCGTDRNSYPFQTTDGIRFCFEKILPDYFEHARWMCKQAVDRGFLLALVVMWCNYVPGTWASNIFPDNIIPKEHLEKIIKTICDSFNSFHPVYLISGDTGFENPSSIERYSLITGLVEHYAPDARKAYHIKGRYDGLPQELAEHADIYLYQSGHNPDAQDQAHILAQSFRKRTPKRPLINSEPCYEQMGYSHHAYGRFRQKEIRSALWNSLLAGASAGITYGAHGIWNWQKPNMPINPIAGEGFLQAMNAHEALVFPGAWDYSYVLRFFRENNIRDLEPYQEVLADYSEYIRAAKITNGLLLYVPTNAPFALNGDYSHASVTIINLDNYNSIPGCVHYKDNKSKIEMHSFYNDVLIYIKTN